MNLDSFGVRQTDSPRVMSLQPQLCSLVQGHRSDPGVPQLVDINWNILCLEAGGRGLKKVWEGLMKMPA